MQWAQGGYTRCNSDLLVVSIKRCTEVLVEQRKFSEADSSLERAFTNIFNKGFRNTLDAAMEGKLVCNRSTQKATTSLRATILYTRLVLPCGQLVLLLFDLGMNMQSNDVRCHGFWKEAMHIKCGISTYSATFGKAGAFKPILCMINFFSCCIFIVRCK